MKKHIEIAACFLGAITASAPAVGEILDGGWRLSAGAVYDSGVKTDFRFMPQQTYVSPYSVSPGALTQSEAKKAAQGTKNGTRTYYKNSNGDESWLDPDDPATGYDAGKTIYYRLPEGAWDGMRSFLLSDTKYEEIYITRESFAAQERSNRDEHSLPGLNLQLSRNLYHDEENNWGLEVAIGVQYECRDDALKSGGGWFVGSSEKRSGTYATTYTADGELGEVLDSPDLMDYFWNYDASGTKIMGQSSETSEDAAIPIDLEGVETEWGEGPTLHDYEYGSYYAKGDYENLDIMLLLQPYYDVCDWFSVNATLGIVCSRQSMDMSVAMFRNGQRVYHSDRDYDQWDVYGIAGLGMMFYWEGWTLSGDFLARFLDDDLEINDRYYKGKVSRGNWMFRLGLGYEF